MKFTHIVWGTNSSQNYSTRHVQGGNGILIFTRKLLSIFFWPRLAGTLKKMSLADIVMHSFRNNDSAFCVCHQVLHKFRHVDIFKYLEAIQNICYEAPRRVNFRRGGRMERERSAVLWMQDLFHRECWLQKKHFRPSDHKEQSEEAATQK